ncbi:MAG: site-specific integrase [Eubacteriales bacterium]|nr:site-specific integrase [Eubacteriales bacterium]
MPTAKRLPSGNWRVRVYIGDDVNGKKLYRSFTDPDRRRAIRLAAEFELKHREAKLSNLFEHAMRQYIIAKKTTLSPNTFREYTNMQKMLTAECPALCKKKIDMLTKLDVQEAVNILSEKRAPKTVKNYAYFISGILRFYDVQMPTATLPARKRPKIHVPTDAVVRQVIALSEGSELEIPILLAAFGPLRRSEICALSMDDISGNVIHVHRGLALGIDNKYHPKTPKTYCSDRFVEFPAPVIAKIRERGYITRMKPYQITMQFSRLLAAHDIPHFRFHDLRHYSASVMHALGIPDAYIMQCGGWSTDGVLKEVYRHTLDDRSPEMRDRANGHFQGLISGQLDDTKDDTPE